MGFAALNPSYGLQPYWRPVWALALARQRMQAAQMKSLVLKGLLVALVFPWALSSMAAEDSAPQAPVVWQGHKYCWYDTGWNGAGWYRCGFDQKAGRGWGGPKDWPGAAGRPPSSGAWFERPPPAPPVSAPSIATERNVEPLRGGAAAGSPAGPLRR
jgi:hypothetical protein